MAFAVGVEHVLPQIPDEILQPRRLGMQVFVHMA